MVTVLRWIETPLCRRRVEIDVRDFLLDERTLAAKYGVPWSRPIDRKVVNLAAVVVGLCLGFAIVRA